MQIPSPKKIDEFKYVSAAGCSLLIKQALINALYSGDMSVSWPETISNKNRKVIFDLLVDEFDFAGWRLFDHGPSISVRPK